MPAGMAARLTRITCLSPGLAGLACPQCCSFGWPPAGSPAPSYAALGPQEEGSQRARGNPQLCSPAWKRRLEFLLSFSSSIFPPTLLLFFPSSTAPPPPAIHKRPETGREREKKKNKLILNFPHCSRSECQSCALIRQKSGVRILASSPSW